MRLAMKSALAAALSGAVLVSLVGLMLWAHSGHKNAGRDYLRADALRRHIHDFSMLAMEGLQRPSDRVRAQWRFEVALTQESLAGLGAVDPLGAARLSQLLVELSQAFDAVILSNDDANPGLQRIRVGRIIARLQEVSAIANQLVHRTSARRQDAENVLLTSIWTSVLSLTFGLPGIWLSFRYAALIPLQTLTEEIADATVETPLDTSAPPRRDEFGDLRLEFAEMQRRLWDAYLDIQEKADRLERSNQELDSFAYVASHDLKAPLRVIENTSRWLEEDLEPYLNDDTRESMVLLRNRVSRMDRLLDDLLEHSRIGRGDQAIQLVSGDELIDDVVALAAVPPGFRIERDPGLAAITVSAMPLRTVLLNLVTNAVKHHDRQTGAIKILLLQRPGWLEFGVQDDGPGIPVEHHDRVFGMFRTLQPRDQVEGSGMGLAIVKKTVELAGGAVWITAGYRRGCMIRFTWPSGSRVTREKEEAA